MKNHWSNWLIRLISRGAYENFFFAGLQLQIDFTIWSYFLGLGITFLWSYFLRSFCCQSNVILLFSGNSFFLSSRMQISVSNFHSRERILPFAKKTVNIYPNILIWLWIAKLMIIWLDYNSIWQNYNNVNAVVDQPIFAPKNSLLSISNGESSLSIQIIQTTTIPKLRMSSN